MKIGVLGINHKLASLELRETLAKACQRRFSFLSQSSYDNSFILLSTCNRTEIYFTSNDLALTHTQLLHILRDEVKDDFDQKIYSYFGSDCFLHLARVTAGLDSAIVAETEIQGQVKVAYETASQYFALPFELHYLFQKALKIGKKVRTEVTIERGMPDLEHAVYQTGMHLFNEDKNKKILFIGASDVNFKILSHLKTKNFNDITLCNRSSEKAKELASAFSLSLLEWTHLKNWHHFDWIILATKSPYPLITSSPKPTQSKLIIDLSVPRNVDPLVGKIPGIALLNIDQINRILKVRQHKMSKTLKEAESFVSHSAKAHIESFKEKTTSRLRLIRI